jgi:peptide deformylase
MRQVVQYPNPILDRPCEPVKFPLSENDAKLIEEMWNTLREYDVGLGLAANQIGAHVRMFVMDTKKYAGGVADVFINPKVTETAGYQIGSEGCLSFGDRTCLVGRPTVAKVEYRDTAGRKKTVILTGITARCALHEIDHLSGVNMTQREKETREGNYGP